MNEINEGSVLLQLLLKFSSEHAVINIREDQDEFTEMDNISFCYLKVLMQKLE